MGASIVSPDYVSSTIGESGDFSTKPEESEEALLSGVRRNFKKTGLMIDCDYLNQNLHLN